MLLIAGLSALLLFVFSNLRFAAEADTVDQLADEPGDEVVESELTDDGTEEDADPDGGSTDTEPAAKAPAKKAPPPREPRGEPIDPKLVSLAYDWGLTPQELGSFRSQRDLQNEILRRKWEDEQEKRTARPEPRKALDPLNVKFDPQDEGSAKTTIDTLVSHVNLLTKELNETREQLATAKPAPGVDPRKLAALEAQIQQANAAMGLQRLDQIVASASDAVKEKLGTPSMSAFDEESEQYAALMDLSEEMGHIRQRAQRRGEKVPSIHQQFERAVRNLWPDDATSTGGSGSNGKAKPQRAAAGALRADRRPNPSARKLDTFADRLKAADEYASLHGIDF